MRHFLTLLVLLFSSVFAHAGENDALEIANLDLNQLDPLTSITSRYVWIEDNDVETLKCVSLACNYISRSPTVHRPIPVMINGTMLVRVDLSALAPTQQDLDEFIKVWEELQFDPKFSLLLTKDTLRFASRDIVIPTVKKTVNKTERVLEDCEPYVSKVDGKTHTRRYVNKEVTETIEVPFKDSDVQVARLASEHLDPNLVSALIAKTHSQAGVVSSKYFLFRALSTIKDKGLFNTIYGGLYYDFAGIKTNNKKGTDLDNLLETLGIGNVEAGVNFQKLFDKLRSDQRVAIFRSDVTGKPRRVLLLKTLVGRESQGIVSITQDFRDQDIDIGTHTMMNLLNLDAQAQEVIWELPNGLNGFAIFDGKGKRIDEVGPDVANDSTIPSPHTQRLQPAIGCIRCHANEGGWKILRNDVKPLLKEGIDIFNDLSDRKNNLADIIDRLTGLYAGDLERKILPRARDDYATAILGATGPWIKSKDQTNVHRLSGEKLGKVYNGYIYETVDAAKALQEFGYKLKKEDDPVKVLRGILRPPNIVLNNVVPIDPREAALLMGLKINRIEFDLDYSFMATRLKKVAQQK